MRDQRTKIALNEQIAERVFRMRFPFELETCEPGQFVMVDVPGETTFLRRPFGIARCDSGAIEICYKVVGRGTEALSRLEKGSELAVLGPCGRGFRPPTKSETAVIVAGGYGIAPLFALAQHLVHAGREVRFFVGGKGERDLFYLDELRALAIEPVIATEDGSAGEKGLVTQPLVRELDAIAKPALFVCGPEGLIKAVAEIGRERGISTQVSLERYMACGIGVCLGCVCENKDGVYVRTCREGPVFEASELKWDEVRKCVSL